jgi:hypothetical protein
MKANFKLLLLLLLVTLSAYANHGNSEFKRTIVKEINTNNDASCKVVNKYGKVIIHTWNKNQIKATITITGFGKTVDEAQSIANLVDIDAGNDDGETQFRTHYNPGTGGRWSLLGGRKDSKDYVNIDYEIYVPVQMQKLSIDNNFGDIITDDLAFPMFISANYCTYNIKSAAKLDMNINYCDKGWIGKVGDMRLNANYSNVKSDEIGKLTVKSNYSQYTVGKIGSLESGVNYCDFTIGKVGELKIQSTYTDFHITDLLTTLNGRMTYGSFEVKNIVSGFKGATLSLTYTDAKLGLSTSIPAMLRLDLSNGSLKTGELSLKNINSIKRNSQLSYSAYTSGGGEASPSIDVRGVYSDVSFTSK